MQKEYLQQQNECYLDDERSRTMRKQLLDQQPEAESVSLDLTKRAYVEWSISHPVIIPIPDNLEDLFTSVNGVQFFRPFC